MVDGQNTKMSIAHAINENNDLDQTRFWNRFWSSASASSPLGSQASELLRDFVGSPAVDLVLEVGVGDGRNLSALCEGCTRFIGIDSSEVAIRRSESRRHNGARVELKVGSAYGLPLPDNSCDLVVATDVMNHLEWPQRFSAEVRRVLKKGGIFLGNAMSTCDPSRKTVSLKGRVLSSKRFLVRWNGGTDKETAWLNMRYYSKEELNKMFRGFVWVAPPAEYTRKDLGHLAPFDTCPHEHVFWKLHLQKS
jgi:ubiquinone/menaquinone biosynthesis C-methylase UbiE